MQVSIIGSGNVATHLAKALTAANVQISNIWSNQFENAKVLAQQVGAKAVEDFASCVHHTDIILVAIKDDAIKDIGKALSQFNGLVAHTSGAIAISALANLKNHGVFYPLQTFSKHKEVNFSTVPICVEANNETSLEALKNLATRVTKSIYEIDSDRRKILHLAAVFACNFPNYLYGIAQQLLAEQKLDFDIIKPLISETANKVQTTLPSLVQTGPAVRNDLQTLAKHEELLKVHPDWLNIYQLLSEQIKNNR